MKTINLTLCNSGVTIRLNIDKIEFYVPLVDEKGTEIGLSSGNSIFCTQDVSVIDYMLEKFIKK